ncbi:MAG: hypothetical protein ABIM89_12940 [Mycobacteriales bacterium]
MPTYDGPLYIASLKPDDPDAPRAAAAAALECAGPPSPNYFGAHDGFPSAAAALEDHVRDEWSYAPRAGYRIERAEEHRVLYSYDIDGRTKAAIIVSDALRPGFGGGWHVESQAYCDAAEWPDEVTDALGVGVWTDKNGVRVPTSSVQSYQGPEHCEWQSATFLHLSDRRQFVRDPQAAISAKFRALYAADAPLPGDATDTGYRLDGKSLWLAADGSAAYVGTAGAFERWPAPAEMVGCA